MQGQRTYTAAPIILLTGFVHDARSFAPRRAHTDSLPGDYGETVMPRRRFANSLMRVRTARLSVRTSARL